jgi:gamma-glutamyltranspeptidase
MKKKLNHLNIMNQCLNLKQVFVKKRKMIIFYSLKDHGTSHCSIIDATGNAVAVTSTINTE